MPSVDDGATVMERALAHAGVTAVVASKGVELVGVVVASCVHCRTGAQSAVHVHTRPGATQGEPAETELPATAIAGGTHSFAPPEARGA